MIRNLLLLAACLSLTSCGMGFRAQWVRAGKNTITDGIAGRWSGSWKSEVNGHTGYLKCIVPPETPGSHKRDFLYRAGWKKVLAATLSAPAEVKPKGKDHQFESRKDLGILGGEFTSKGTVSGDDFRATYHSSLDHGTFTMQRVP
jgi:hypothetical protein